MVTIQILPAIYANGTLTELRVGAEAQRRRKHEDLTQRRKGAELLFEILSFKFHDLCFKNNISKITRS
jgi:hypothetical protein